MPRLALRRRRSADTFPAAAGAIAAGLAVGATLGFLLGELFGPTASRVIRTRRATPDDAPSAASLVDLALTALDADLPLRAARLDVVPVGRQAIEIHGWVDDRRARSRAGRLVADAVAPAKVVNCLLVHGEDDLPWQEQAPEPDADARPA